MFKVPGQTEPTINHGPSLGYGNFQSIFRHCELKPTLSYLLVRMINLGGGLRSLSAICIVFSSSATNSLTTQHPFSSSNWSHPDSEHPFVTYTDYCPLLVGRVTLLTSSWCVPMERFCSDVAARFATFR